MDESSDVVEGKAEAEDAEGDEISIEIIGKEELSIFQLPISKN